MRRASFDTLAFVKWTLPDAQSAAPEAWCEAVGPAFVARAPTADPPARGPASDTLVVVTWNVRAGAGDVRALIRELKSGELTGWPVREFALLLQEAYRASPVVPVGGEVGLTSRISVTPPSGVRVDVQELAASAGLHAFYAPSMPNGSPERGGPPEDRGNAILSTLPLTELSALELPFEAQRRVAVTATVSGRGTDGANWGVRLVSSHLDTRSRWSRLLDSFGRGRARQARELARSLEGEAVVLGADLNTWSTPFLEGALDILYERFPDTPRFEGATFAAAGVLPRRLDHLLVRLPDGHTTDVHRVPKRYGSDHHPVIAVVRFPTSGVAQGLDEGSL